MNDARDRIVELSSERNRDGKPPLSDEDVMEQFKRIRDGAAAWLEQCVIAAKKDGMKDAQNMFNYASGQISIMERKSKV